jgi:hypothetical protein
LSLSCWFQISGSASIFGNVLSSLLDSSLFDLCLLLEVNVSFGANVSVVQDSVFKLINS